MAAKIGHLAAFAILAGCMPRLAARITATVRCQLRRLCYFVPPACQKTLLLRLDRYVNSWCVGVEPTRKCSAQPTEKKTTRKTGTSRLPAGAASAGVMNIPASEMTSERRPANRQYYHLLLKQLTLIFGKAPIPTLLTTTCTPMKDRIIIIATIKTSGAAGEGLFKLAVIHWR